MHYIAKLGCKILTNRIEHFVHKHNIMSTTHFGFRKKSSTKVAIASFLSKSHDSIVTYKYNCAVFLDLSKAFDCINHSILITKINGYGIRGLVSKLILNIMEDRSVRTRIASTLSNTHRISSGLPQGSSLSPLLYNLYVNDLKEILETHEELIQYADDTTIIIGGDSILELENKTKHAINKFKSYFNVIGLKFNKDKTQIMMLKKSKIMGCSAYSENSILCGEKSVKFLGTCINHKLTLEPHILHICKKNNILYINHNRTSKMD
jgi:hypothetical protein